MKRLHIHLAVENLKQNIHFYSTLFGCEPTAQHDDYAKWMLDDPRVNFAISNQSTQLGLDHPGIQAENDHELQMIKQRLDATQGIAWESFQSLAGIPIFNDKKSPTWAWWRLLLWQLTIRWCFPVKPHRRTDQEDFANH